jgi:predicted RNA-binding Zn-ribbon protein involved in translation (DUF1610 family)
MRYNFEGYPRIHIKNAWFLAIKRLSLQKASMSVEPGAFRLDLVTLAPRRTDPALPSRTFNPGKGTMEPQSLESDEKKQWDSAHKCPHCGHVINLRDLDLRDVATGVVACPSCGWVGPVEIQIIE